MATKANKVPVAWIKVYGRDNLFKASFVHCEDAAAFCFILGKGSQARNGHAKKNLLWHEGFESLSAGHSYDFAAKTMYSRASSDDEQSP